MWQTLLTCVWHYVYHVFSSLWEILSWKMSLLVISKILGLFVNTLAADGKYSFSDSENLPQPITTQLSKKKIFFSKFLLHLLNLHKTLNCTKKKMTLMAYVFSKLETVKNLVSWISKNHSFRTHFDSRHGKGCVTLLKAGAKTFYHICSQIWGKWVEKCLS